MTNTKKTRRSLRKTVGRKSVGRKRKTIGGSKTPSPPKRMSNSGAAIAPLPSPVPFHGTVTRDGPPGYEPPRLPPFSVTGMDVAMVQGKRISSAKTLLLKAYKNPTKKNIDAAYIAVHNTTEHNVRGRNLKKEKLITADYNQTGNGRFGLDESGPDVWNITDNGDITIPVQYAR
jgi:hypothetical protein